MSGQPGFFDLPDRYDALSRGGDPLLQLDTLVPWAVFRNPLKKALKRKTRNKGGRPPFDDVVMFKILVLQALYNLSDDQMEYQIRDRLSFMRFLGLDLDDRVPDAKTIWLFRNTLAKAQAVEVLFARFERYLEENGLRASGGQLIDASLVRVPHQRNNKDENRQIKAGETPENWEEKPEKLRQKDMTARWTKKHGQSHYGYKNHINVDRKYKLIRRYEVSDASVHDSQVFENVLHKKNRSKDIWADSAYRSGEREEMLKRRGFRSHIHHKGKRGHPLSEAKRKTNQRRSKVRARVEHVFASQSQMGSRIIRSIGMVRVKAAIGLRNLAYNMKRYICLNGEKYA